jgi:hypothetical protein
MSTKNFIIRVTITLTIVMLLLMATPIQPAYALTCLITANTNWSALTCGTGGGTPTAADTVQISNGATLTVDVTNAVAGNIQIDSGSLLSTGSNNLSIKGNWTNNAGTSGFTSSSTVTFNATSGTQTLSGNTTFYNLTLNNAGATTSFGSSAITISNIFTVNAGTMNGGTSTIIFTGSSGSMAGVGAKKFNHLQIDNGAAISNSSGGNITINGNFTNNGTFLQNSTLTTTFGGTSQGLSGSGSTTFGNITIQSTATVNAGSHNITITGVSFTANGTFNGGSATVTFDGATTLNAGSSGVFGFNNIIINSGKSLSNTKNFNITGTWTNNGTYTPGGETITFNGSSSQVLNGATTFSNLTINNSNGLTLNSNLTVNNIITLTSGKISTGSNSLILPATASITGVNTSKYVVGNIQRAFTDTAASFNFPIGDPSVYAPLNISFTNVSASGDITASVSGSDCASTSSSDINLNESVNHCWTLTNNGVSASSYDATFNYGNGSDVDAIATPANFIVNKFNGSAWSQITVSGTPGATSTNTTGINSFGSFAIGEAKTTTSLIVSAASGTYRGATDLSATISPAMSGKTISFSLNGSPVGATTTNSGGIATLSNVSLAGNDAGNYASAISANFTGDEENKASSNTANLTVNTAAVSPSFTVSNKTYDGNTSAEILTRSLTGVLNSDDVTLAGGSASFDTKDAETGKTVTASGFTLSGAKADNYHLSSTIATTTADITRAELTISGLTAFDKIYDGNTSAVLAGAPQLNGVLGLEDVSLTGTPSGEFSDANAAPSKTVTITGLNLSGADKDNYFLTLPTTTASITKRDINVQANGQSKIYGESDPSFTYTNDPLSGSDTFTGNLTRDTGENAGDHAITQGSLTAGNNYNILFTGANLTIHKRDITIGAVNDSKTYDGTTSSSATPIIIDGQLQFNDTLNFTQSFDDPNTGGRTLSVSGTINDGNSGNNYNVTTQTASGSISTKTITVTAQDKTQYAGNPDPAFTYTSSGFIGADDFITAPTCGVSVDHSTFGDYPITCSGADAGANYAIQYFDGTLTASPKLTLNVTTDDLTITYGDSDPTFTPHFSGFTNDDNESVLTTLPTCSATGPFTHTGSPYTITCSGGSDEKYDFHYTDGLLVVNAKAINVTANAHSKTYGASDPLLDYTHDALIGADTFNGSLTRDSGEEIGDYNITQGTLSLSDNYALNFTGGTFTIHKATLTVTADDQNIQSGSPDPAFTFHYSGFVLGEDESALDTKPSCAVNIPHPTSGSYAITCSGGTDDHYDFVYMPGTLTVNSVMNQTATFYSTKNEDGWIIESSETSLKGGSVNNGGSMLQVGDDAKNRQYRAILSFDTHTLPGTAVITSVTLKIKRPATGFLVGDNNPFAWGGGLKADVCRNFFGTSIALQIVDFNYNNTTNCKLLAGTFGATPSASWYSTNLVNTAFTKINKTGFTQFRIYFSKDDNNDLTADYLNFFSGNSTAANRPTLIIYFYMP